MAASKLSFMKDALILFAITLVSGLCLGLVYDITLEPIAQATIEANNATYREVLSTADSFTEIESSADTIARTAEEISGLGYGSVAVESALVGTDAGGTAVGYVINAMSGESYGGVVRISVGFDMEGTITGLGIREISDTPGLGMKATEDEYRSQFIGKNAESLTVTKSGASADNEIDAISGATVTSSATTNAVNAALYYLHNYIE